MSLNTAHIDGGVLIHQGEMILLHAPQAVLTFTGNDELKKVGERVGNAYLTSHRLIFIAKKNTQNFHSFSFPFVVLSQVDVEQPLFGANNLRGKVRAQPDGGWRGEAKFKIAFKAGGAIEFATGMMKAIQLAKQMSGNNQQYWDSPPPCYADVTGGNIHPAPQNYYQQPQNYYGWNAPAYNFPQPDANSIYISDLPPPYAGIGGQPGFAGGFAPPAYQPPPYTPSNPAYPQQPGFTYPSQPPQQQPPQQQQNGFYPPPQQPQATNGNPTASGGFYPPSAPNNVAYSDNNGGNVYVPSYDPPPMMNKKNQ